MVDCVSNQWFSYFSALENYRAKALNDKLSDLMQCTSVQDRHEISHGEASNRGCRASNDICTDICASNDIHTNALGFNDICTDSHASNDICDPFWENVPKCVDKICS